MTVRTRMAPSPTGEYHIGHIRTVLYNYAYSKKNNGKFLIRIEDTDRDRFVEGATERILDVITDYGLNWDEGPQRGGEVGPYVQSERLDIYKKYAQELVNKKKAYYCFCTKERLETLRTEQQAQGLLVTKYDKKCLNLSDEQIANNLRNGMPYVIRLNVPADEEITFLDKVFGQITINSNDIDDQVLLKSDGYPSYHLGVVVDDHLMGVTHIMRGNDWIPSTPKHVLLYKAFGWVMPELIHLPNLKELGESKKLSKRFGSVYAIEFLREGYLPEALLNFLMFLGWNPGTEKEIYSLEEFVNDFTLERLHKTDLVSFDREKLLWLNGFYIRQMSPDLLLQKYLSWVEKFNIELVNDLKTSAIGVEIIKLIQDRLKKFSEVSDLISYFFEKPRQEVDLLNKYAKDNDYKKIIAHYYTLYSNLDVNSWTSYELDKISHDLMMEKGYKPKEAFMTIRVAVTGREATPPLFDTLAVLGKDEVLSRLSLALGNQ